MAPACMHPDAKAFVRDWPSTLLEPKPYTLNPETLEALSLNPQAKTVESGKAIAPPQL